MTPSLTLEAVCCERGGRLLFDDFTLSLAPGEAALVTGINGAGKSSLLRVIAGLLTPVSGIVANSGGTALADDRLALDPERSLAAALGFWAKLDGHSADVGAMGLGALADVPVRMLSTGQRKRAALARVVASGAGIWLLDEPGNGLDDASLRLLGEAMASHRARGGIIVAASHQSLALSGARTIGL